MKYIPYLYIIPLALLTACSSEELSTPSPESGNGAIQLSAGIVESGAKLVTRAGEENADHSKHLLLTSGTVLALRVSGTWTGHTPSTSIVQTTTATVGAETEANSKHNAVTCDPVLYWDDYGTADPANTSTGRATGLTIYGAAVNGKDTIPTISAAQWTSGLPWGVAADQTATGWQPADKDLLISNNVQSSTAVADKELDTGTYKFDERGYGKLLEFTHALSKITVNLKAGAGFAGGVFAATPTVTLTNNGAAHNWPYTKGTVNVTDGTWGSQGSVTPVTMNAAASVTDSYDVTKEALVIPGSAFTSDAADIVKINADGNIYYVQAEKIRTAINSATHGTDGAYLTEAGKNYIINVTVNKTDIVVTATVTDWTDVTAALVAPVINVSGSYGDEDEALSDGFAFSFYRSTALNDGYSDDESLIENSFYKEESVVSKTSSLWTMSPTLYWPNHNTHYQFRGVWPRTVTTSGAGILTSPRVEVANHDDTDYQVIKVQNVAYSSGTFPSDLQIARPEFADKTEECTNSETGHTTTNLWSGGICATEGTINLNFKYMMSQVEVNLSTTDNSLGDAVNLTNAVVEIVNVYNTGDVKLGDRDVILTGSKGSYTLNPVAGEGNENKRWSAIVPQELTYSTPHAAGNVKFRITITNADSSTDIYYADVEPIKESGKLTKVAPNGVWEAGVHYIYNLVLSKTKVNVSATLADWTTVSANENVWF